MWSRAAVTALVPAAAATAAMAVMAVMAHVAFAHPAGFTSVNRYVGVSCDARGRIHIAYLLDFAELSAYAEIEQLDADHDGSVSPAEQRAYLDRRLPPLLDQWTVEIDGVRARLRVVGSSLEALPGERGLSTLRIAADLATEDVPPPGPRAPGALDALDVKVRVVDPVFGDRSGWRQMVAEGSSGAAVVEGPASRSADALAYANPALSNPATGGPPRVDDATFSFRVRALTTAAAPGAAGADSIAPDDRRAPGLRLSSPGSARGRWTFSALALALALSLRAAHARLPGHGKALAAAYGLLLAMMLCASAWLPGFPRPW